MPEQTAGEAIHFNRFLTPEERQRLGDVQQWHWITSFKPELSLTFRDAEIEAFFADKATLHRPQHRRVMLTLSGEIPYYGFERCYRRGPGFVFLFDRREPSQFRTHPRYRGSSTKTLWLHLRDHSDLLTFEIFCGGGQHLLPMRVMQGGRVVRLTQAWNHVSADPDCPLAWNYLQSSLTSLFLEILGTATPEHPPDHHQQVVAYIRDYITHHFNEPLKLEELAAMAGYSPSFFHQLFRRHTGVTPLEHLQQIRIQKALDWLREGYTIEAIVEKCGIASEAHFRRLFKARMRLTPSVARSMFSDEG